MNQIAVNRERDAMALAITLTLLATGCARAPHRDVAPEGATSEAVNNARHPSQAPDPNAPVTVVPGDKVKPLPVPVEPAPSDQPVPNQPAPPDKPAPDKPAVEPSAEPAGNANAQPTSNTVNVVKTRSALGTNLDQLADWSPEQPLVDIFKTSRAWISASETEWRDQRPLSLDASGWVRALLPGQIARTTMLWEGVKLPAGNFVVLTEGEGTVEYALQRGAKEVVSHRGAGRHVVAFDPAQGGLSIAIIATNPQNPLRNIRVLMPGGVCETDPAAWCSENNPCARGACLPFESNYQQNPFNPLFLDKIRNYRVLRFMDWMNTNDDGRRTWNERPKITDARYTVRGAPVELMVDLTNRSGKDAWFCMSHLADDDFVTRFAATVRDRLQPAHKAYVEYSNEVWNSAFPQADHARHLGMRSRLGKSEYEAQMRAYARRATQVMKLWERAFGSPKRLVRVIASQAGNDWVSKTILSFEDTAKHADALAIAPYFGGRLGSPEEQGRVGRMSIEQLFAELRTKSLPDSAQWTADQARVAKKFSVDLIAYEGGQHLTGVGPVTENDRINDLFDKANRDPRMKTIYAKYLADWRQNGGKLFVHFSNCARVSKWGRWGALEALTQPRSAAPKFDALQDFIQRNPPWWSEGSAKK